MDRNLLILGLAKKAGLLAVGAEDTNSAARTGKVSVVVSAGDASVGAMRRADNSARAACAPHIVAPFTCFELGSVSGRGSPGTVAILDAGLAARFLKGLADTEPDRYSDAAELLRARAEETKRPPSGKRRSVQ